MCADRVPADRRDVVDGGDEPREELVLARAELEPAADRLVGRRAHLVRAPAPEKVLAPEGEAHVRPEELVRRADQHVAAPGGDVDRTVRAVVDGVDPGERARLVRQLDDAAHVGRGADRVRRRREGDHSASCRRAAVRGRRGRARGRRARRRSVTTIPMSSASASQGATFASWSRRVTSTSSPGLELSRERAREQEVEGRHALPERHLSRVAAEERRRRARAPRRPARPCAATSRTALRRWRCPRAGTGRSRRSPRRGTACPRARRRRRVGRPSAE